MRIEQKKQTARDQYDKQEIRIAACVDEDTGELQSVTPIDTANETAANLYLYSNCHRISDMDYEAVRDHAQALAQRGMDRDWIREKLLACCRHWSGLEKGDFKRRKFSVAILRGVRHYEMFADALAATFDADRTQTERFKAKDWNY